MSEDKQTKKVTPEMKLEQERLARRPKQASIPNEDKYKSEIAELSEVVAERDETIEKLQASLDAGDVLLSTADDNLKEANETIAKLKDESATAIEERDETIAELKRELATVIEEFAEANDELATAIAERDEARVALEEAEATE